MAEVRHRGACRCGRAITKIENSAVKTVRRDRARFVYENREDTGWCIFRCEDCSEVIDTTWQPAEPALAVANG